MFVTSYNKLGDQIVNINILKGITNVNNAYGVEITKSKCLFVN